MSLKTGNVFAEFGADQPGRYKISHLVSDDSDGGATRNVKLIPKLPNVRAVDRVDVFAVCIATNCFFPVVFSF